MLRSFGQAWNRIFAIAKKEFKQFYRDKLLLFAYFFLPVILVVILGYALNFDLFGIRVGVMDKDHSYESRKLINMLGHSEYFTLSAAISNDNQIDKYINENRLRCVIVIPENFSHSFNSNEDIKIQLLVDGAEGSIAAAVASYLKSALFRFSSNLSEERLIRNGHNSSPGIDLRTIFLYNSDLRSARFFVPGLIAIILTIVAVVSLSMSIAIEKENGTIDQLSISHASFAEVITGKTLMYSAVIYSTFIVILFVAYIFFGIYIKGNILLLAVSAVIFLFATLNLGLFVSSISNTRQVAFQFATFVSLSPSIILSGFVFPVENMPEVIKILSNMTPAKFFIVILRSLLIKGAGLAAIWPQILSLVGFGLFFFFLSIILNMKKPGR